VLDSLGIAKISVGLPYFNAIFVPLAAAVALVVGVGALVRWKNDNVMAIVKKMSWAIVVSVIAGIAVPFMMGGFKPAAALGVALACWVFLTTLQGVFERLKNRNNKLVALFSIPAGFWGMTLGHLGIAVFSVGVSLTSLYSIETDLRMARGEVHEMAGYQFEFQGVEQVQGPNYSADEGLLVVTRNGVEVAQLAAQKRDYSSQMGIMTEAAIDPGLTRDLFFALGESLNGNDEWSMRIYYKPYVRWIWLGAFLMGLGGLIAVTDRRYRKVKVRQTSRSESTVSAT
jgi:cytochrome c-type biogenesis protein CcmF